MLWAQSPLVTGSELRQGTVTMVLKVQFHTSTTVDKQQQAHGRGRGQINPIWLDLNNAHSHLPSTKCLGDIKGCHIFKQMSITVQYDAESELICVHKDRIQQ